MFYYPLFCCIFPQKPIDKNELYILHLAIDWKIRQKRGCPINYRQSLKFLNTSWAGIAKLDFDLNEKSATQGQNSFSKDRGVYSTRPRIE